MVDNPAFVDSADPATVTRMLEKAPHVTVMPKSNTTLDGSQLREGQGQ